MMDGLAPLEVCGKGRNAGRNFHLVFLAPKLGSHRISGDESIEKVDLTLEKRSQLEKGKKDKRMRRDGGKHFLSQFLQP
jgi:hypothetical protein